MTLSKHGDKQICSISRYLSTVSLRLQMDYPNTWISWFTRQLDLELKFSSIISLRTAKWNKWAESFTDLFALTLSSTYSLALFIRWWLFCMDLSIGFIYFIWWLYLFALSMGISLNVYSIHPHSNLSQFFSHLRKEHLYISLNIHIPSSHGKNFRFPLRHHSYLIQLTLLQLHRHTSLIKLTNTTSLHHIPYTCSLIKLTNITSFHHNYYTRSILTLHYSNVISYCSGSTDLLISSDIHLLHLSSILLLAQRCASYSISNYIWNTSKLLLLSGDVEINPVPRPIDQNPEFCTICSKKINRGPQQDMTPTCSGENCSARCPDPLMFISRSNWSCERFWSLYRMEMSSTWH